MLEAADKAVELAHGGELVAMAILIDETTRVVVQGMTGKEGRFHSLRNRDYGTKVVAGMTPGRGGQDVEGIPVFDTVAEAVARHRGQHVAHLRAGPVRRRRAVRGGRRRRPPRRPASPRASRSRTWPGP